MKKAILAKLLAVCLLLAFFSYPAFAVDEEQALTGQVVTGTAATSETATGTKVVATGFSDVQRASPVYNAVTYLNQIGVLGGYPDGTFKPDNAINRAEVLKVILKGSAIEPATTFTADFPDVTSDAWFAPYVLKAKGLGIVKGDETTGAFAPARQVNLAEFLKMLIAANGISVDALSGKTVGNISADAWYAPYVVYAATLGIVTPDEKGNVDASRALNRGEVSNMLYLFNIVKNGKDTQFLLNRAEAEMAQIEVYIAANQVALAKNASELAVDLTQQAYKNLPENKVVLGAAKLARAYDYLVNSFILGVQKKNAESSDWANQAITKATEAWEANNATQPIAKHIKDRAREILTQVGGIEGQPYPTQPATAPAQ
ncbi:S-layer homology domain-containing protein [Candidatus Peregrinibacteria bacterium]|nr:S-layer homology domain-containing protein [Candidatus Peregrinibacteria bacterium]